MISLQMDAAQFECVKKYASSEDAQLKAHDFKLSNMSADGTTGHIHTKEIDADFEFRGNALVLDNEQKHGLYGFASDKTIGGHLVSILGDLKCEEESSIPVPAENSATTVPPATNTNPQTPATSNAVSQLVKPVVSA
jgi:hypothetical protein